MKTLLAVPPSKESLVSLEYMVNHGIKFQYIGRRLMIRADSNPVGVACRRSLFRMAVLFLAELEPLFAGEFCNNCACELDDHEKQGEPLCLDCVLDGTAERPEFFREALEASS